MKKVIVDKLVEALFKQHRLRDSFEERQGLLNGIPHNIVGGLPSCQRDSPNEHLTKVVEFVSDLGRVDDEYGNRVSATEIFGKNALRGVDGSDAGTELKEILGEFEDLLKVPAVPSTSGDGGDGDGGDGDGGDGEDEFLEAFAEQVEIVAKMCEKYEDLEQELVEQLEIGNDVAKADRPLKICRAVNERFKPWLFGLLEPAAKRAGVPGDEVMDFASKTVFLALAPKFAIGLKAQSSSGLIIPSEAGSWVQGLIKSWVRPKATPSLAVGGLEQTISGVWESGPVVDAAYRDLKIGLFKNWEIDPSNPNADNLLEGHLEGAFYSYTPFHICLKEESGVADGISKLITADPCLSSLFVLIRSSSAGLHTGHNDISYAVALERLLENYFGVG